MAKLDPFAYASYRVQAEPYTFTCEEYPDVELTLFLKPLDIISTYQVIENTKILTEKHTGPKGLPYKVNGMPIPLSEPLIQSLITILMMETGTTEYPVYSLEELLGIVINLPVLWLKIQDMALEINNKKKLLVPPKSPTNESELTDSQVLGESSVPSQLDSTPIPS